RDPGSPGAICLGTAGRFHPHALARKLERKFDKRSERNSLERNSSTRGQTNALVLSLASRRALSRLVRLPLREDGFPPGQPRILSLQRCRHPQSSAHPAGSRNAALATLRIFRPLCAHAGGVAGPASSAANKGGCPSANSVLDSVRISLRAARLSCFYVGRGWGGAGSLHVAGCPARNSGAGLD